MKKAQINIFQKGINSDLDYAFRTNDMWAFPTLNYRLINKEGQGIIMTTLPSNTRNIDSVVSPDGEEFKLKDGFIALGCNEYKGILYIISYKQTTGETELGTFPSYNDTLNTWERKYKALTNYITNPDNEFRTTLFTNSLEHMVDVMLKESYDSSVDIYLCDGINPNRVINSGFREDGLSNNRTYTNEDFYSSINLIASTTGIINTQLLSIEQGGQLKYGNYYLYFRYLTADYTRTSFVGECGICQVYKGDKINKDVEGGKWDTASNKKIQIRLSNVDTSYRYIEVVSVRYYGDDAMIPATEVGLIDKYYDINPNSTDLDITIIGTETILPFTEAEVIKPNIIERTCKTQDQADNRYFGGNWSSPDKNSDFLANLILNIKPEIKLLNVKDGSFNVNADVVYDIQGEMQYKDYMLTYDKVGYFRGETYAFAVGVLFKDGSESNVFPITGEDFVTGATNTNGLIRFPFHDTCPIYKSYSGSENQLNILGVKFNMALFNNALNVLSAQNKEWFKQNVKGIFFTRTKRNKWLQYQGLSIVGSNGTRKNETYFSNVGYLHEWHNANFNQNAYSYNVPYYRKINYSFGENKLYAYKFWNHPAYDDVFGLIPYNTNEFDVEPSGSGIMPLFMSFLPMMSVNPGGSDLDNDAKHWGYYCQRSYIEPEYYGVFSPDFIFNKSNGDISNNKYVKIVSKTSGRTATRWDFPDDNNSVLFPYIQIAHQMAVPSHPSNLWLTTERTFSLGDNGVDNKPVNHINNMVNQVFDYKTDKTNLFGFVAFSVDSYNCNRNIYLRKYIGLKINSADIDKTNPYDSEKQIDLAIVNIYNFEREDDLNILYPTLKSYIYYKIGQVISIDYNNDTEHFDMPSEIIRFYGDCFLQRTYIKIQTYDCSLFKGKDADILACNIDTSDSPVCSKLDNDNQMDNKTTAYYHGVIVGIVTENEMNTAMRHSREEYSYFPKYGYYGFSYMPLNANGIEDFVINAGYNETLGIKAYSFYDDTMPFEVNKRPTRIRFSNKHTPYSFVDGYRIFDINAFQDYDMSNGQIMSLRVFNNILLSVQEKAVNRHEYGRSEVKAPTNMGDIVLGSADYLSPYALKLIDYGTQHQFSIRVTNSGVYGVDVNKRIIWGTALDKTMSGGVSINITPLSKIKYVDSYLNNLLDEYNYRRSDRLSKYNDMPALYDGVVTSYDKMYDEVIFTFLRKVKTYDIYFANSMNWYFMNGHYFPQMILNSTLQQSTNYEVGKIYMFNSVLYACIKDFNTGIDNDINNYIGEYLMLANDIIASEYNFNATYKDEWVLIRDGQCNPYISIARGIAKICKIASDGYALVYVEGERYGYEICENPLPIGISVCVKIREHLDKCNSIVYSEYLQCFIGERDYHSHIYPLVENDYFSFSPYLRNKCYLHNRDNNDLIMYNLQRESLLSVIVNGSGGESNNTMFEKAYDNLSILTNKIPFKSINFETENHIGMKDPFDSLGIDFWSDPEWLENKYYIPVQCQTEWSNNEFIEETQMRGTWLKITLKYMGNIRKYIKSIITEYTNSEA